MSPILATFQSLNLQLMHSRAFPSQSVPVAAIPPSEPTLMTINIGHGKPFLPTPLTVVTSGKTRRGSSFKISGFGELYSGQIRNVLQSHETIPLLESARRVRVHPLCFPRTCTAISMGPTMLCFPQFRPTRCSITGLGHGLFTHTRSMTGPSGKSTWNQVPCPLLLFPTPL